MTLTRKHCDEAVSRLLDADAGAVLPAEVAAHVALCAECALVARDLGAFRALVADARTDIDAHVPPPDVLGVIAGAARTPEAQRPLRLVQGGASAPVAPATRRGATPTRVIPIALAVAAGLVAVTAAAVLLQPDAPSPREVPRVVLRDTGEHPDAPHRQPEPAGPALAVTGPAPAPLEPAIERAERKDATTHPRRSSPGGSNPRSPGTSEGPVGPGPEVEAQRTLRRQMPRLQSCYERALRRDLRLGDVRADLTVDIAQDGAIQGVEVSGDATPELRRCLEQTVRNAQFPGSDTGLRVSVPLRFEVVRERMGTNVAPHSTNSTNGTTRE